MLHLIDYFKLKGKIFYYFCALININYFLFASVAELVDALDSKSSSFGSVGSIPTRGTSNLNIPL